MKAVGAIILRDCAGFAGAAAISYGAWRIYEPSGFIIGGVLLLAAAIVMARN